MSTQVVGMRAYADALRHFSSVESSLQQGVPVSKETLFAKTLDQTLLRDSVDRPENFGAQGDFIKMAGQEHTRLGHVNDFTETLSGSLNRVNELQKEKAMAVDAFASGRNQNVHELMITMQKSSMAMKLTTAVRGKVLEAYKELTKMQF